MRIFVSGHRGLLGSACVRRLKCEHEVLTSNLDLGNAGLVRDWFAMNPVDAVIHCAARVGGVKANKDYPVEFIVDNLRIQNAVIQGAAEAKVERFINIGTSCLYPRDCPVPVKETALLTGPFEPSVEAYAIAKLAGYALIEAHRTQFGRKQWTTVAPCNLWGRNDSYGPHSHVIPALIQRLDKSIRERTPLVVWGDGSATREFMFADDAAAAIQHVLCNFALPPDLINIGTGVGTTIRQLVEILIDISGEDVKVIWDTSKPVGIPHKTLDCSILCESGWRPTSTLRAGLSAVWDDFRNNHNIRLKP